jgi:hypothetical protein
MEQVVEEFRSSSGKEKISEVLLSYATPLRRAFPGAPTLKETQRLLQICADVWNAVVARRHPDQAALDVPGYARILNEVRTLIKCSEVEAVGHIRDLIDRKESLFPHETHQIAAVEATLTEAGGLFVMAGRLSIQDAG